MSVALAIGIAIVGISGLCILVFVFAACRVAGPYDDTSDRMFAELGLDRVKSRPRQAGRLVNTHEGDAHHGKAHRR